jgi:adenylosuccinate synthase
MKMASEALIVVDLGYGDAGKGTIVDYLTRERGAHTVVRFNGGPQAGHNVVTPDGRHHTFAQFGSGTFVDGVKTVLSRFMLIEPYALLNEAKHLEEIGVGDAIDRLIIDARCPVITPAHQAANRLRELSRGPAAHGTCGLGIGETMADLAAGAADVIRAGELRDSHVLRQKLRATADRKLAECRPMLRAWPSEAATLSDPAWIDVAVGNYALLADRAAIVLPDEIHRLLNEPGTVIFEGAQGILLDESFGFHPHTTWSTTTTANAQTLLDETGFVGTRERIGVLRTYATRHGPGPFVTDDPGLRDVLPEQHNRDDGWQGRFRVGPFDLVATRYALSVCPVDSLAITHADRLPQLPPRACGAYACAGERIENLAAPAPADIEARTRLTKLLGECRPIYTPSADDFFQFLRSELRTPIRITSSGPTADGVAKYADPRVEAG